MTFIVMPGVQDGSFLSIEKTFKNISRYLRELEPLVLESYLLEWKNPRELGSSSGIVRQFQGTLHVLKIVDENTDFIFWSSVLPDDWPGGDVYAVVVYSNETTSQAVSGSLDAVLFQVGDQMTKSAASSTLSMPAISTTLDVAGPVKSDAQVSVEADILVAFKLEVDRSSSAGDFYFIQAGTLLIPDSQFKTRALEVTP